MWRVLAQVRLVATARKVFTPPVLGTASEMRPQRASREFFCSVRDGSFRAIAIRVSSPSQTSWIALALAQSLRAFALPTNVKPPDRGLGISATFSRMASVRRAFIGESQFNSRNHRKLSHVIQPFLILGVTSR